MAQTPCIAQYYNDLSQIGFSKNVIIPVAESVDVESFTATRPFVPLSGWLNTPGRATMVDNNANQSVFSSLFDECYIASVNNLGGIASLPSITTGTFSQYLAKKLAAAETLNLSRYNHFRDLVTNFWLNIDLGNTPQEYDSICQQFQKYLIDTVDKSFFISPGVYQFSVIAGNQFAIDWKAWKAANPNLVGIEVLEIVSI